MASKQDPQEVKAKKTKNLEIVMKHGTGLYKVQYEGGGQLPLELTGAFTDRSKAEIAVEFYLENR